MSGAGESGGKIALVLQGGGARGAYHVGVIRAIAEIAGPGHSPFQIVCGASVGAINAAAVAVAATDFQAGAAHLEELWRGLDSRSIFDTRALPLIATGARWAMTPVLGPLGFTTTGGILDYAPLHRLLCEEFSQEKLRGAIEAGALHAICITATSYTQGISVTYYQGIEEIADWERARRRGVRVALEPGHLLASAALPFAFAPVRLEEGYFGDGALRLNAPLSPAIHTGAEKIVVITTRDGQPDGPGHRKGTPSLGAMAGHALDILFNDNLEADYERLTRVNRTLSLIPPEARAETPLKPIEALLLRPSRDVRAMAKAEAGSLPRALRLMVRGLGSTQGDGQIESYLMFEPAFIGQMIDLGHADTMARADEIRALFDMG